MPSRWLKNSLLCCLLLLSGCLTAAESQPMQFPHSRVEIFTSKALGEYEITTYWPEQSSPEQGWPVVYILDGRQYAPIATTIVRSQSCARCALNDGVIVSIDYRGPSRRGYDFTPAPAVFVAELLPNGERNQPDRYGGASLFRQFLAKELMPVINQRFHINPREQSLFGHSLGGLFVLDTLLHQPTLFTHYIAASPSLWFSQGDMLKQFQSAIIEHRLDVTQPASLFMTVGGLEESLTDEESRLPCEKQRLLLAHRQHRQQIANSQQLADRLRQLNHDKWRFHYQIYPQQTHYTAPVFTLQDSLSALFKKRLGNTADAE